jgi:hypothetical protein
MFRAAQQFFGQIFGQIGLPVPWFRCLKASVYKEFYEYPVKPGKLPPGFPASRKVLRFRIGLFPL